MMLNTSKEAALLTLLIFGFCNLKAVSCDKDDGSDRNKKHFSLFSVVTFANEQCSSETTFNGGQLTGTCYSTSECSDKAGTKSGNCAAGFGVCCIFIYNTLVNGIFSENRTYIQNPLYPASETAGAGTTTTFTVNKMQSDICQLRLDFDEFVIAGPANTQEYQIATQLDGNCNDKWATVLTSGASVPAFCGIMTGEHVYMDLGMEAADNAVISLSFAAATVTTASVAGILPANVVRKYRVKTSQIPCWAPYRAPDGCHRYLTTTVGNIVSPNFADLTSLTRGANFMNPRTELMMQDLRTCIRREAGYCCVLFQVCNSFQGTEMTRAASGASQANGDQNIISQGWSFHTWLLNAGDAGDGPKLGDITQNDIGIVDGGCTTDYVEIPDSSPGIKTYGSAPTTVNTRYCGARFGWFPAISRVAGNNNHAPVWDCTEPFEVNYFTDNVNDNGLQTVANAPTVLNVPRGFCLDYVQEAC